MLNPFTYSDTNKRYYTFDYYLKQKYGEKVAKIALDGGFSCPNRDGKISTGGCIFCSNVGSGEFAGDKNKDVVTQYQEGKQVFINKWNVKKFIAYFQAFSNTYGNIDKLKQCFDPFILIDDCVNITIATRPDCFNDEIYNYLEKLNKQKEVVIELGLQTSNDLTSKKINRGYSFSTFVNTVYELKKRHLRVVVHIINGLLNETKDDMLQTINDLNSLPIDGIKIHSLNILKDTPLALIYHKYHILTLEEYVNIVVSQLSILREDIVIERITGDARKEDLITPLWSIKKTIVTNEIDKEMKRRNTYQGEYYHLSKAVLKSHEIIKTIDHKIVAVDATLGNGHDSLFLAFNFKKIFAFDIQDLAIKRSQKRLINAKNVTIINDNFINITNYYRGKIDLVLYNLGFLPGSNKKIISKKEDTLLSITKVLEFAKHIIVVFYTKHDDSQEYIFIKNYLDNKKIKYQLINNLNDEIIIHINCN